MIIELEMLQKKLHALPDFPPEMKTLLEHLIISHHGQYEFGSPKLPMFPEALMLHYLDDLDSKMESMRAHFEREAENDSSWTSYNASLGRTLLNTAKFLKKEESAVAAAAAASAAESSMNAASSSSDIDPEPVSVASTASLAFEDGEG
jgi:3'-5' exoribonuclease